MIEGKAVRTEQLSVRYRKGDPPALHRLDLEVERGMIQGVLGPNGAGKSTLISVLCGVRDPQEGKVEVLGHPLPSEKEAMKRRIGLVPQEIALFPSLTAKENLIYIARLQGLSSRGLKDLVKERLNEFGLAEKANERVDRLSGGMKRRLNLLAGILHGPELLFLDEPTTGVDLHSRELIIERLHELKKEGVTILYTSHDLHETRELCDRVALMQRGELILENNADSPDLEGERLRELLLKLSKEEKASYAP